MIFIALILITSTYYYIGNYIFSIPVFGLYLNYVRCTKLTKLNEYIDNNDNKKSKFLKYCKNNLSKINLNTNNLSYSNFILYNNYNNNKLFLLIIKLDTVTIFIINDLLLFFLFYIKKLVSFIISNQFSFNPKKNNLNKIQNNNNTKTNILNKDDIDEKKKNLIDLISKKYK